MKSQSAKDRFDATVADLRAKHVVGPKKWFKSLALMIIASFLVSYGWELLNPTPVPVDIADHSKYVLFSVLAGAILLLLPLTLILTVYAFIGVFRFKTKSMEALKVLSQELIEEMKDKTRS